MHMSGFPLLERAVNGPAHAIANCTTGVANMVCGDKPLEFSKLRRAFEAGRCPPRLYAEKPPWQASEVRLEAVATIMENLKVPVGWPPVPISVSAMSTMKLEQALAFAGDLGQYVVGLLDIDDVLRTHFLAYLRVLKDCMQKTPVIPVADIKARLDQAAASLEAILPHYWTHVTKHSAVHLDLFLINWGCFWAANELVHERIMAKLKRLAKHGNKNRMATLAKNWDTFQTANDWLLDSDLDLKYEVILNMLSYIAIYAIV